MITTLPDLSATDVIVLHERLIVVCNDFTKDIRDLTFSQNEAALTEIATRKVNSWVQFYLYDGLFGPAYIANNTRHEPLDHRAFFAITSPDDPTYATAVHPSSVTRYCQQRGDFRAYHLGRQREGTAGNLVGHYSYLVLPTPLVIGCTYLITQSDGRSVTLSYDLNKTISRAIKVAQQGYLPSAGRKYAYLGAWTPGVGPVSFDHIIDQAWEVVDSISGAVVLGGTVPPAFAKDPHYVTFTFSRPASGENLHRIDLSALTALGEFYLRIPGVGRSWPFRHSAEAYGRAFYTHLRGLWHKRAGHELPAAFTAWPRPLAHATASRLDYAVEAINNRPPISDFEAIKTLTANAGAAVPIQEPVTGGWYDAADYDRRWFHHKAVYDLLLAYEIAPKNFTDGQENTQESGDGIPDILNEAAWGLRIWRCGQDPATGGVPGHVETTQHPDSRDALPDGRPHHDPLHYYFSAATRDSSMIYAAGAAHVGRLIKAFNMAEGQAWIDSAQRAYEFGVNPDNHYARDSYIGSGKPYRESDGTLACDWCLAALELWRATNTASYQTDALARYSAMVKALVWPFRFTAMYTFWWPWYGVSSEYSETQRAGYKATADALTKLTRQDFYALPLSLTDPFSPAWGKSCGMQDASLLVLAAALLPTDAMRKDWLDAAALSCDWQHGCNPLGISWTSGIGSLYPWCFFDGEAEEDGIIDPVPGITVYGITGGTALSGRRAGYSFASDAGSVWSIAKRLLPDYLATGGDGAPAVPYFRAWSPDYHSDPGMQEWTVWETISPSVLVFGALMGAGWMPSDALKATKPRTDLSTWMLP